MLEVLLLVEVVFLRVTSQIWPDRVATYISSGQPANLIDDTSPIPTRSGSRLTSTCDCAVLHSITTNTTVAGMSEMSGTLALIPIKLKERTRWDR